jgi:hypothetical protein
MNGMGMFINTNVSAINANRNLSYNNTQLSKVAEKLSSGYRINRAADDAAGLAISEKLRYQINGYNQALRNAQDGISMIQTAEGALTEVHSILQRLNTLATQAANGTLQDEDRDQIQLEVDQLVQELSNITGKTKFNGITLLNGKSRYQQPIRCASRTDEDPIGDHESVQSAGDARCRSEPSGAYDQQCRRQRREPVRFRIPHSRRRHRARNDRVYEEPNSRSSRYGDAGASQRHSAERSSSAGLIGILRFNSPIVRLGSFSIHFLSFYADKIEEKLTKNKG